MDNIEEVLTPNISEVTLLDWWESDKDVADSAWVSTAKQKRTEEDVYRVITQSIVPLHHDTPKESVWMKFWIRCPIYVERQLDKYRMTTQKQDFKVEWEEGEFGRWNISQNELSLRYKTMPNTYITMPKDVYDISGPTIAMLYEQIMSSQETSYEKIISKLKQKVDDKTITYAELKRAREFLRGMLGTGFFTDMQLILNLNSFEHIMNQRLKPDAQPETQFVAKLMLKEVVDKKVAPITIEKMIEVNKW